jgi:hypothetical protein
MNYEDDIEKWKAIWDKAQEKGIFGDSPKEEKAPDYKSDFFGSWCPEENSATNYKDIDAKYWDKVYRLSNHQGETTDEVISEQEKDDIWEKPQNQKLRNTPSKDGLSNASAELANTANPVEPPTRGIDQRKKVTPNWADGMKVRELAEMKYNLFNLENKLNMNPKFGSYSGDSPEIKGIQTQIDDLRDRIDKLSNSISPDFIEDESS